MSKIVRIFIYVLCLSLVAIISGCVATYCILLFFGIDIRDALAHSQAQSEARSTVQPEAVNLYRRVEAMPPINSAKLYSESPLQFDEEGTMDCTYSRGKWQYDTQQNYETVLDQFTQAFSAIAWRADQRHLIGGINETVFSSDKDQTQWVVLTQNEPHEPSYHTGFTLEIGVVELRCSYG